MDAALYFLVLPAISSEDWWDMQAHEIDWLELVLLTADPCLWWATYMADTELVERMLDGVV